MTKVLLIHTKNLLNFSDVGNNAGDKLQRNFSRELQFMVQKFNEASNYNNEAKMNVYIKTETQLNVYFNLFDDTKILSNIIDKLIEMYDHIQLFKSKIYPEVYDYEKCKFENSHWFRKYN